METASIAITTELISTPNDIKMAIYKNSDPNVIVQSITESGTHAPRTWNFENLERVMHLYKLLELNGSGDVIDTIIGPIYFLPSNEEFEVKNPKLIKVGTTAIPGDPDDTPWPADVNTVNVPDWIGWQIESFERVGQGSLKMDDAQAIDVSHDKLGGDVALLNEDDVFQIDEWFLISFVPKIIQSGGSGSGGSGAAVGFSAILIITANTTLTAADIGKKILIFPSGTYLEITMPSLSTVPERVITYFEMGGGTTMKCARIKAATGQVINWLEGNLSDLYTCPSESFEMYKRVIGGITNEWRVQAAEGNFKTVGEGMYDDMDAASVFNKVPIATALHFQTYARLYNRYVLRLPSSLVVTYSQWLTGGNNKRKWSLKDSASGNFFTPDVGDLFERVSDNTILHPAGMYEDDKMRNHQHEQTIGKLGSAPFNSGTISRVIGNYNGTSNSLSDFTSGHYIFQSGLWIVPDNDETAPRSRRTCKYYRC